MKKMESFCNFALTLTRNLSQSKKFTYMHLKSLVTHFQKMVLIIILWLTVLGILEFEVEEFVKFLLSQHVFDILIANI